MKKNLRSGEALHKEYPKTVSANDFWGQVSRTVNGKPVSEAQIQMIVKAIREALNFSRDDELLDICCGNGALSRYFFDEISAFYGIDFSAYLIEISKANFEIHPTHMFEEAEANSYLDSETQPERFTKALCYGSFSYFANNEAERFLTTLYRRFVNVDLLFIGNLPDLDKAQNFFPPGTNFDDKVNDSQSTIGIWRSKKQFSELALRSGWETNFSSMPEAFYSSHYRYGVQLRRKSAQSR